jgi:molecular chaperone GrpE
VTDPRPNGPDVPGPGSDGAPDPDAAPHQGDAGGQGAPAPGTGGTDPEPAAADRGNPGGGAEGDAGGELSVESLLADLERVTAERDQYLEGYQRAMADFDNFRKQAQRRQDDAVDRSLGGFVERLLPALDACDAALAHGATEVEPILTALYQALEKEGLARVAPTGEPFDPAVAEAVVHEPGDGGEHIVSEVLRAGYTWNGRVLRPAMVKVTD